MDSFKYQGANNDERRAAKDAGIKSPLVAHEFGLPLALPMLIIAAAWFFEMRRRSRRRAREAMELAASGRVGAAESRAR